MSRSIRRAPERYGDIGFISLGFHCDLSLRALCHVRIHPDGIVIGFFENEGSISLKDIRSGLLVCVLQRSGELHFPSKSKDFKFDSNGYVLYEVNLNVLKIWDLRRISVSRICLGLSTSCAISPARGGSFLLGNANVIDLIWLKNFDLKNSVSYKFSCKFMFCNSISDYAVMINEDESISIYHSL